MATIGREELDAKLGRTEARVEAVEARIDASLEKLSSEISGFQKEISGDFKALRTELNHKPGIWQMMSAIAASTAAILATLIGILAFGADRFDGGVQVAGVSVEQAIEAKRISEENGKKIDDMVARFSVVLDRLETDAGTK